MCSFSPLVQDCLLPVFAPPFKWTPAGNATEFLYFCFTLFLYWSGTRSQSTNPAAPKLKERYIGTDYISLYLIHLTIPISCLIIMIYTNVQNTRAPTPQIVPQSLLSLPPFGYCPFRKPLCRYLRPLSQPHLICYSMFSRFILPFQLRGIRLTRACSVLPAFPADTSCPACQTFPLHNNTSPFSWNFFTFTKGEKFPCEVIHISPTLHTRSCARTLPHVALVIEEA